MALDLIRARCPTMEGAMEEDDGEVELTLGLSVGGSSRKAPMADSVAQGRAAEAKSGEVDFDLGVPVSSPPSSPRPPPPFLHVDRDGGAALDQARRREIHALRRREARRKRDEKKQQHQRRGICRMTGGAAPAATATQLESKCSPEDRIAMEAQEQLVRTKDREARVEALDSVPNHKLSANHSPIPNTDANPDPILNPNCVPFAAQSFPMLAMPYSYPHLQYFPTANGFGIPCMMPCWAPAMSPAADGPRTEGNVFHPVACRAFQPYAPPPDEATNRGSPVSSHADYAVESSAGKGAGVDAVERAPSWTASQGSSSSSAASGHHNASPKGSRSGGRSSSRSGTSDGRSHSGQSPGKHHLHPQRPLPQVTSLPRGQSDNSISSRPTEPDPPPEVRSQTPCPNGGPSPAKPVAPAGGDPGPAPRQAGPRPQLPRMPCVSATGNGPNGRTITGVLYRYTTSEVSIVCACHGSSFSPAEFVQHAGGTDVTHPLRQITVVSS
ncbi:hypothetical protein Taro_028433 [Colocasia esculenta]|uniref:Ninja-family protein n=1 Tax=Colocasia esculenta TaxID=4460 RepID=A0A843VH88_COLES|nr:hypothetical protein [Colocasia esculenta]